MVYHFRFHMAMEGTKWITSELSSCMLWKIILFEKAAVETARGPFEQRKHILNRMSFFG